MDAGKLMWTARCDEIHCVSFDDWWYKKAKTLHQVPITVNVQLVHPCLKPSISDVAESC